MSGAPAPEAMLHVFLNYACQAKCAFCYNPPLTPELVRWTLPLERIAAELLNGRRDGYTGVTFSGGEITLMADLPKILRLAKKAGYESIGIISNGIRLADAGYFASLVGAGLGFCCLSVHAADAALHDRIVAVPGAFEKALASIERLRGAAIPFLLNFVLVKDNAGEAPRFVERFAGVSEVVEFQLYFPHYQGLMAEAPRGYGLSMSEAAAQFCAARAAARAAGIDEKVWYYNMPPCAAPDLRDRLRNWEREAGARLVDPRGLVEGEFRPSLERKDRVKPEPCSRCALNARCLGCETAYVERYGAAELKPLAEAA